MIILQLSQEELEKLISGAVRNAFSMTVKSNPNPDRDIWFNLTQLCEYHPDKPSKQTVYGWISAGKIPYHKGAKKVSFLKSEIDTWLKANRKKTNAELTAGAGDMLTKKKYAA